MKQKEHERLIYVTNFAGHAVVEGFSEARLKYLNKYLQRWHHAPVSEEAFKEVMAKVEARWRAMRTFILRAETPYGTVFWSGDHWDSDPAIGKVFELADGEINDEIKRIFRLQPFPANLILPVKRESPNEIIDLAVS